MISKDPGEAFTPNSTLCLSHYKCELFYVLTRIKCKFDHIGCLAKATTLRQFLSKTKSYNIEKSTAYPRGIL